MGRSSLTVKTVPDDNLAIYAAMGVARPGDILVVATDNWTGSCVIGDLVAALFNNIGLAGVVTDGMAMPDWVKEYLAGDRVKYIK